MDPATILDHLQQLSDGPIVDVGVSCWFCYARLLPTREIIAFDIHAGMVELLTTYAKADGLGYLATKLMPSPADLPLAGASVVMLVVLKVQHELDHSRSLLRECRRILQPISPLVIVD